MDPISILAVTGATLGIAGTIAGGKQAKASANYNASLQRSRAYETLRAAAQREELQREQLTDASAAQRAAFGENGIDTSSGSALIAVQQGMRDAEMDALLTRYEGVLEARSQFQGAEVTKYEGRAAQRQSYFSAAGQLIGAAGSYMGRRQARPLAPVESRTPTPVPSISRPFG